jgi:PIN domain nuclease of toxin-antitoxin system
MSEIILLDTHIWVWWINEELQKLSATQIEMIEQSERVAISVVSCFEMAQIVKKGRLILPLPVREWIGKALTPAGIEALPLSAEISCQAVDLTEIHKDPFDRLIIATALNYQCRLISADGNFPSYPELGNSLIF